MPSKQPATKRLFFSVHSYGDSSVGPIKAKVAQSRLFSAEILYSDRSATTTVVIQRTSATTKRIRSATRYG
jgi:hypothetical protein